MKLKTITVAVAGLASLAIAGSALAQKKYDPGATDKEIKVGNINPYSGPASAYGAIGKSISAYFDKVNANKIHRHQF
jgi:branched-chain amino acid transport system substrate-binding protein